MSDAQRSASMSHRTESSEWRSGFSGSGAPAQQEAIGGGYWIGTIR